MMEKQYYEIDNKGTIIGQFHTKPELAEDCIVVHSMPPPNSMLYPRWIDGAWTDAATCTEHEEHINHLTDNAIKKWCRNKGKNEEYYINCGIKIAIENIKDTSNMNFRHYKEYRDFVTKQIELGKQEKKEHTS